MLHLILAHGFEEIEALTTVDILRRLGLEVRLTSITGARSVTGAHGITVMADSIFRKTEIEKCDGIILPGGMPGAKHLLQCDALCKSIFSLHQSGKLLAAICAAPIVLGKVEVLKGKKATCYPGFEKELIGASIRKSMVVTDGNVITAKGPGASVAFALAIAEKFVEQEKIEQLKADMFLV